jgi:dTDP-4-dehydrorhamnose reductase
LALRFNAELPGQLAVECSKRGLRFLHISTDAVFDGQYGAYREEDTPNPLSVYARTKLEGEYAVQQAYPAAIIVRTVFFGWSLSGVRSLAEQFLKRLMAGDSMPGHTDRIFSPLLANDLAQIILEMLAKDLHGLFHAESPDSLSKYDFGVKLASRFGFDSSLIHPVNFMQAGLEAARAPNLSLHSGKLVTALNHKLPGIDESIEAFYQLHQSSYPDKLRALLIDSVVDHKAA